MGTIRRRAAAVLFFIDTVTQAPVSGGGINIQIRQQSPIIRKDDGYVVILAQNGVDSLDIAVSGTGFLPVALHIDLSAEAPGMIRYIYLLPSPDYLFTPQMAVIFGTCATRGLYAVRTADCGRYKLMEDFDAGKDMIRLWGIDKFLQGQQLLLNEEEQYALVTLLEPDDETERGYRIRERFRACFHKGKTRVYSIIRIFPDENGSFCVAYDKIRKGGETIRFLGEDICAQGKGTKADIKIDTQVAIQEGQQIEIHMGECTECAGLPKEENVS